MVPDTPDEIMGRLIEAFEVIAATGRSEGPKAVLAAWPDYRRKIARCRRIFPPAAISRADEALTWFSLIEDADSRRALQFEVLCKAGGGSFSKVCRNYGWTRTTVTSRNRALLKQLADRATRPV